MISGQDLVNPFPDFNPYLHVSNLTDIIFFSECSLASPGSPCTNLEAKDCKYDWIGEYCCCGQCSDSPWLSLACVLDATTGEKLWQRTYSHCPAEGCGIEGEWRIACKNYLDLTLKDFLPQGLSRHQTTLATILT